MQRPQIPDSLPVPRSALHREHVPRYIHIDAKLAIR